MLEQAATGRGWRSLAQPSRIGWPACAALAAMLLVIYRQPISVLIGIWLDSPEYNYGPAVPIIAALMIWRDSQRKTAPGSTGWPGVAVVLCGLLLRLIGRFTDLPVASQFGLVLALIGLVVAAVGYRRALTLWPGLVFLLFALPLSDAAQFDLTWRLQLVSSDGGVAVLRAFGIPVLQEGNVIDLGAIQLQVAEACSGLRYLFPLATFGFICAYLFVASPLVRILTFLSSLPITIVMNSVRIGVTGILVDRYGIEAAEGFFHYFEGWVVFCLCIAILTLEMKFFCLIDGRGRSLLRRLDLDPPSWRFGAVKPQRGPLAVITVLGIATLAAGPWIQHRLDEVARTAAEQPRASFAVFPRSISGWSGFDAPIDRQSLQVLKPTDYLSLNFQRGTSEVVNTWIAYYATGSGLHSPLLCIPGGGWEIEQLSEIDLPATSGVAMPPMKINRLIIRRGVDRQVVYYWFQGRGRIEANQNFATFRGIIDALTTNQRGQALVRFVTPIRDTADIPAADQRMMDFIAQAAPLLSKYIP
jgi:exosortase D (VPLPA-CTERM-specific)